MSTLADKVAVQDLLIAMARAASAEQRRNAFGQLLARLNYNRRQGKASLALPQSVAAEEVADKPYLIATAGQSDDFHVIFARMAGEQLSRTLERAIIASLLADHPYGLFVFANSDYSRWHLVNVRVARDSISEENANPKLRRMFRRISISPEDRLRTATERIERLDLAHIHPELFGLTALAIQKAHDDAFDVEAVTRDFFKRYREVFEEMEQKLIKGIADKDTLRLFTQRLFNRLMFIAFIQRKGWLRIEGMDDNHYLDGLWSDYRAKRKDDSNFYNERLRQLFFHGLNTPNDVNRVTLGSGKHAPKGMIQRLIGDVPYLNGGLFEKADDGTDDDLSIAIPDKAIDLILHGLFACFNFTVAESTPLDVEVAVDPEMLGKVFEELVTGRHESGSYYTPKPIVSFMCREALKGYLQTKVPGESEEAIALLVDEHNPTRLKDGEAVLDALRKVRVCDPACGSGAYLLGMMHELLDLRACLFASNRHLDAKSVFDRKLEIIQTNVYGVDMDPFAVNIARLRLWLSLAVDYDGPVDELPPLPNLDFKIEQGDSLAAPDPSGAGQLALQRITVDEFLDLKAKFLRSHSDEKKRLKKEIDALRAKLRKWAHAQGEVDGFDWAVEFAEVFLDGGFNVVVANPPYIRMELFKDQKPILRRNFAAVHADRSDLYCYFYARAVELLSTSGMLAFISSNKWLRSKYGTRLRSYMGSKCWIRTIVDFRDLPVFESASAYPMVFVATKGDSRRDTSYTAVQSLDAPYPDVGRIVIEHGESIPHSRLLGEQWMLAGGAEAARFAKMETGIPLNEYMGGHVLYGIKTGLNEAFLLSAAERNQLLHECPDAASVIRPCVSGKAIRRWCIADEQQYLLYMEHGVSIKGLDALLKRMRPYRDRLESRATAQAWYELQQPQAAYADQFAKPKLVFPDIAAEARFALDTVGAFPLNTAYGMPTADLFLLGVLNSQPVGDYYANISSQVRGGYLRFIRQYIERIPVPDAADHDKLAIERLVRKCLDVKGQDCEAWEKEIDERIAALYGL